MILSLPFPENHSNIGGCSRFDFIPSDHVQSILVNTFFNTVSLIELKNGTSFLSGYASKGSLSYNEDMRQNDAGLHFLTKITGFYPGLTAQALTILRKMTEHCHIVVLTDNNGRKRLIGNLCTPLEFTFKQQTGRNVSQRNGFEFTFRAQLQSMSPVMNISY